jgi:hypothetical protein
MHFFCIDKLICADYINSKDYLFGNYVLVHERKFEIPAKNEIVQIKNSAISLWKSETEILIVNFLEKINSETDTENSGIEPHLEWKIIFLETICVKACCKSNRIINF